MQPEHLRPAFADVFIPQLKAAGITHIVSVPDGYLAVLIDLARKAGVDLTPVAREEEAFAVAAGLRMAGKKPLVMIQNVGFLNSIGCFATLCLNYRTPFSVLVAHRGNLYDKNNYDILKFRYFENILNVMNLRTISWHGYAHEPQLLSLVAQLAETAREPAFLLLDMPPAGTAPMKGPQ